MKDNITSERVAVVTLSLIAINIGAYIWTADDALLPLAANLMFLWIFGGSIEDAMGRVRYLAFYVLGGLLSVAVALALDAEAIPMVGATGAGATVLGGYLVHYPRGRVLTALLIPFLFTIVAIPAVAFLGAWAAVQVAVATLDLNSAIGSDKPVEYLAPVVGLLFGAASVKLLATHQSAGYMPDDAIADST